ncbi:pilus assembly protein PilP [Geobacter sp. AOG1]|uniref:pilus assembly protein PilP n=1 Tax=Geobacter sp. AOG1 TaxID=1566346 RepID=UPI001CC373D3|nr:pilus assembly protein PilP [Geobacter sp. AOG1]
MIKRARNKQFILLALTLLLVPGCQKTAPPPQAQQPPAPVVQVQKPVQKQQSSARVEGPKTSVLDFNLKKDPFKPLIVAATPTAGKTAAPVISKNANLLPIQSFDSSKFKVSGIVAGLKENKALVIDPAGKGYVVKQGMLIGNNNGRITKISNNAIEIAEQYRDESGHTKKRVIKLTLSPKR